MPFLNNFLDSLTKENDKLFHMGVLNSSKGKDHALIFQGNKNIKSKEKQIVKKPKSEIEDESSKPTDEDSVKKGKKKGSTSKCYYFSKVFHSEKNCFNNNMGIMSHLFEKHKMEFLDELEKHVDSSEQCHSANFQGDIKYAFSGRVKYFSHVFDIYLVSDI